jgi:hypothetical protein
MSARHASGGATNGDGPPCASATVRSLASGRRLSGSGGRSLSGDGHFVSVTLCPSRLWVLTVFNLMGLEMMARRREPRTLLLAR